MARERVRVAGAEVLLVQLVGGTLTLYSPFLGKVEIAATTIQTFSTTESIEIHTEDGRRRPRPSACAPDFLDAALGTEADRPLDEAKVVHTQHAQGCGYQFSAS